MKDSIRSPDSNQQQSKKLLTNESFVRESSHSDGKNAFTNLLNRGQIATNADINAIGIIIENRLKKNSFMYFLT